MDAASTDGDLANAVRANRRVPLCLADTAPSADMDAISTDGDPTTALRAKGAASGLADTAPPADVDAASPDGDLSTDATTHLDARRHAHARL